MQEPIDFHDICIIHQPSFGEILKYKIPKFEQLLLPYYITIDSLNVELSEEQKNQIKSFDIVMSSFGIVRLLYKSLKFFTKSRIRHDSYGLYMEGFKGRLNRDNFDEFAEIILDICARKRPEKEKIPVFANERQKDIWLKLQEGRKRNSRRNELRLEDVLQVCEYGGEYYISKDIIRSFTLWEIMNCYKAKVGMSNYKDSFSIYLISGEKSLIEDKHWTELIKIENMSKE
jgi:hypothetical protein